MAAVRGSACAHPAAATHAGIWAAAAATGLHVREVLGDTTAVWRPGSLPNNPDAFRVHMLQACRCTCVLHTRPTRVRDASRPRGSAPGHISTTPLPADQAARCQYVYGSRNFGQLCMVTRISSRGYMPCSSSGTFTSLPVTNSSGLLKASSSAEAHKGAATGAVPRQVGRGHNAPDPHFRSQAGWVRSQASAVCGACSARILRSDMVRVK